jgi:hypothetical protein
MGRKSREHRERREKRLGSKPAEKTAMLEEEIRRLKEEDVVFWNARDCPADMRETHLEDILAFESVSTGTSLFSGLMENGIDLPPPETLDEEQSAKKIGQVVSALMELQIILVGFEHMSAREFYRTLWNETLWEGCHVKKRLPGAFTIMDVSHSISKSEILKIIEEAARANSVQ